MLLSSFVLLEEDCLQVPVDDETLLSFTVLVLSQSYFKNTSGPLAYGF